MFTVDKNTQPIYWYAYFGKIEERLGEPNNDHEFASYAQAYDYAIATKQESLRRRYNEINARVSSLGRRIFALRALWNSTVRKNLAARYARLAEAKAACDTVPTVEVILLPDQIPVEGERLALGTKVYKIDTWGLTFEELLVTRERISYYSWHNEGSANYRLSEGNNYVNATLKSVYSNVEFYLDKQKATARIRTLWEQKVHKLEEQIKAL